MLETHAHRLDVAEVIREARRARHPHARWGDVEIEWDRSREVLVLDDDYEIDLVRVRVRVPSTGRLVPGPFLALCPRGCGARARVLWLPVRSSEVFPVCRACAGVEYLTPQMTELERARVAFSKLWRALGIPKYGTHEPRPGQHRATYLREAAGLERARLRVEFECRRISEHSRARDGFAEDGNVGGPFMSGTCSSRPRRIAPIVYPPEV